MNILGIDEAGRGPCIGPMVICAAMIDEKKADHLSEIGVKDSKLLTPSQRQMMFVKLSKLIRYEIIVVSPEEIDKAVYGTGGLNLNWLEATKSAELINMLKPDKAIIDCPSPNIGAYTSFIEERLKEKPELVVEHKADANHLIAAAASVIAKVTRDREVEKIQEKVKEPIGSGYPADPVTKKFLMKNFDKYPEIFRHSWACYKTLKEMKYQKDLEEF